LIGAVNVLLAGINHTPVKPFGDFEQLGWSRLLMARRHPFDDRQIGNFAGKTVIVDGVERFEQTRLRALIPLCRIRDTLPVRKRHDVIQVSPVFIGISGTKQRIRTVTAIAAKADKQRQCTASDGTVASLSKLIRTGRKTTVFQQIGFDCVK
jgi:hypothetical protein